MDVSDGFERTLVAILLEVRGRASEVLTLRHENFDLDAMMNL